LLALVPLFTLALAACAPPKSTTVRLPSGAEAPAVTDSAFVALLDSLIADGEGDAAFVCVLQFEDPELPPLTDDMEPLEDAGHDVWIVWGTATALRHYMDNPNVRFIGEYFPEYKYNHTLAGAGVAWVYVEIFGGDLQEHYDEMAALGIESIRWDSIVRRFYCKATGDQIVELASSWWVRRIYRARSRWSWWQGLVAHVPQHHPAAAEEYECENAEVSCGPYPLATPRDRTQAGRCDLGEPRSQIAAETDRAHPREEIQNGPTHQQQDDAGRNQPTANGGG
jgi:hypothetical protein